MNSSLEEVFRLSCYSRCTDFPIWLHLPVPVQFGGALSLEQARGDALNSQLSQNVATRGGAIHMNLNAEFQDTDGVMFANEASQEGGSIYCTFCTMRLVRTVVRFSVAQRDGGSFWLSSSAVASLQDVYIVDSSVVQGNGGGVFLSVASSLTLVVCCCCAHPTCEFPSFPYLFLR